MSLNYRKDIDGLRAVAVLLVVFYHLRLPYVTGGYIGVDVFFVISGFLITSIIVREIDKGTFSLLNFYERRIRRILPALFCVVFATMSVGYFILFPPEFEYFGQSVLSTIGFASNILFWKESGYFEVEADLVPLLHTWSLAVEEQFYILFPFYVLLVSKFCRRWRTALTLICFCLSLVMSVVALEYAKYSAVFYLLPPRGWELLMGSLLALSVFSPLKNKMACQILGLIGICLILYAGFYFDDNTLFPGAYALFPTLGAGLLIYTGMNMNTFSSKILSLRVPVFIGKISYSLYLWHWPLIVFYNYASPLEMTNLSRALIFVSAFLLSVLSWRYVEQPFRQNKDRARGRVFLLAGGASLLLALVGGSIYLLKGIPDRFPEDVQKLADATVGYPLPSIKHLGFEGYGGELGALDQKPSFIVWGDSHAQAAIPALDSMAKDAGQKGYLLEDSGCMPSLETISIFEEACNDFNQDVLTFIKDNPEITRVIMISRWSAYARRLNRTDETKSFDEHLKIVFETLTAHGKDIYFVVEVPQLAMKRVPLYLARAKYYGQEVHLETSLKDHLEKQKTVYKTIENLKGNYKFSILYPHNALCHEDICAVIHDGRPLYYDDDHLSTYGASHIQDAYRSLFQ